MPPKASSKEEEPRKGPRVKKPTQRAIESKLQELKASRRASVRKEVKSWLNQNNDPEQDQKQTDQDKGEAVAGHEDAEGNSIHQELDNLSVKSSASVISLSRLNAEVKAVELNAKATAQKMKQELARKEFKLAQEMEERAFMLKQEEEAIDLKTALEISTAKAKLFSHLEKVGSDYQVKLESEPNLMESYINSDMKPHVQDFVQPSLVSSDGATSMAEAFQDIVKQQNEITQTLVKQSIKSTLPTRTIPIFSGDPLEFRLFIRAFEHGIVDKTDSLKDRIYFLEQFTSGEPQELVKSCIHMDPETGYSRAMELLQKNFGNPYKISTSFIQKAMSWPNIKAEDPDDIKRFSLFLLGCLNTMKDIEYMKELNHPKNLKVLMNKLPFKLRSRWRGFAFEITDKGKIVNFEDFVTFVDKQSRILNEPVFGNIVEKETVKPKPRGKQAKSKSTYATTVANPSFRGVDKRQATATRSCLYCNRSNHTLESCRCLLSKPQEEKIKFLKSNKLCFRCLANDGHMSRNCTQGLSCEICSGHHPTVLHRDNSVQKDSNPVPEVKNGFTVGMKSRCAMSIVPVTIKAINSDKYINTYAFLDTGSSASFCSENLMRKLNLEGKRTRINLSTMSDKSKPVSCYLVRGLEISGLNSKTFIQLPELYTQDKMPVSKNDIPKQSDIEIWPYLSHITIPTIPADIEILIGSNVPKAIEPYEIIRSQANGPYAVKTILGWSVNGPLKTPDKGASFGNKDADVIVNRIHVAPNLEEQLQQYYNQDFNEKLADDKPELSREDHRFLDLAQKSIHFENGHYVLGLPFKGDLVNMPNNKPLVQQRIALLLKRFKKDKDFYQEYKIFMDNVIQNGYAREVPSEQLNQSDGRVWYLPHHGVYHPKKNKLRVVFDCAARFGGTSLNDQLLQGPNLTNSLLGTLLRFRQDKVAFMGDIESMFHQVHVPPEDASLLRFLWWKDGDIDNEPVEYQMMVHLFGASSSPSCANYALRQTTHDHQEHFSKAVTDTVLKNFYVDDCLKNQPTDAAAIPLVADLMHLCAKGGFRLTKWVSNSRAVLESLSVEDRAKEMKEIDLDKDSLPLERALGVQWDPQLDTFGFNTVDKSKPATRRGILSVTSSVYDPIGLLSPFIFKAKLILQDLCRLKIGWDDEIPPEYLIQWQKWLSDLPRISEFQTERCIKPKDFDKIVSIQLHHMSDSSEKGYGVVSYLRLVNHDGRIHCCLLLSKSRVAPLKQISIPRMELTAASIAVCMDKMIRKELEITLDESIFWTDSTAVLKYIRNRSTRFKTFVANRLQIIHDGSKPSQWCYIDTQVNPADHVSRGLWAEEFLSCKSWLNGPEFLWKCLEDWPTYPKVQASLLGASNDDLEIKSAAIAIEQPKENEAVGFGSVRKLINYYSSWYKLKRGIAQILRVREELLRRSRLRKDISASNDAIGFGTLAISELKKAEKAILVFIQRDNFQDELRALQDKSSCGVRKTSPLYKLDPVLKDNLIRVGGRLNKAAMPENAKHPIILPKNSHVSKIILEQIHQDLLHSGRNYMISKLRQNYWITNANLAARKVISECVTCRRHRSKVGQQKMSDLPEDRLLPDKAVFSHSGADFFGPIEVKCRRSVVKRYGLLFTCLSTRAIHIEMADSLDTDSCINAIRRFIARRGQVEKIRSDNGSNFIATEKELKTAIMNLDHTKIQQTLLYRGIAWEFNPPYAPHQGGVWERQIGTVKRALRFVLKNQSLNDEGLLTLLCEVEAVINGRPLTKASDDPNDLEVLTPNHLLLLNTKPAMPPGTFSKNDMYVRRRWRQVQFLANLFWKRWLREYLPLLQQRQKWLKPKRNIKVGDVVLIVDDKAPRNSWPMATVIETFPDRKGLTRKAKVQTATKNIFERPITKLCTLLEMD